MYSLYEKSYKNYEYRTQPPGQGGNRKIYGNIYGICRSEIEFMQKDNQKWLSFFVGVRRLKSIPTVLFVHSLGNDFCPELIYNLSCKEE